MSKYDKLEYKKKDRKYNIMRSHDQSHDRSNIIGIIHTITLNKDSLLIIRH